MRTEVERAVIRDTPDRIAALRLAQGDLCEAGRVHDLVLEEADAAAVEVTLAPEPPASS
jgi:hypothetical protein